MFLHDGTHIHSLVKLSRIIRTNVKSGNRKIIFLSLNQNICCGYSKEPSQCDESFENPKHMLKIIGNKIFTIYAEYFCLSKPVNIKDIWYLNELCL